jgi:hypothetical protein
MARWLSPGALASLSAFLISIGIEVHTPPFSHILDIFGGLVALAGLLYAWFGSSPKPLMTSSDD